MKQKLSLNLLLVAVLVALVSQSAPIQAQEKPGITVAPAKVELNLPDGASSATADISITNSFESEITMAAFFEPVDPITGRLNTSGDVPANYSANPNVLTIAPGKSGVVTIKLEDSPNIRPGGSYVALVLRQAATEAGQIGLQPAVSISVYTLKQRGAVYKLIASPLNIPRLSLALPKEVTIQFKNQGNVPLTPRGVVTTSVGSTVIQKSVINEGSVSVRPDDAITLENTYLNVSSRFLPAKLTSVFTYRYDGEATPVGTTSTTLWYVPSQFLIVLLIGVLVLSILVWSILRLVRMRRLQRSKHVSTTTPQVTESHSRASSKTPDEPTEPLGKTTQETPPGDIEGEAIKITVRRVPKQTKESKKALESPQKTRSIKVQIAEEIPRDNSSKK